MGSSGIGDILNIARGSLNVNSQSVRVIGNNIANVNTPGYTRRTTNLVSRDATEASQLGFGNGVKIQSVVRNVDDFLNNQYLTNISGRSRSEARSDLLTRAESSFALDGGPGTIGYELTNFFSSLSTLATNPSSVTLRSDVISKGQSLTDAINGSYNQVAGLQREADNRLGSLVGQVNTLTATVADLNSQILATENGDQENLGLRDQRDNAIQQLSGLIGIDTVEDDRGVVNVSLHNGFSLVTGVSSRDLEFEKSPDFAPVGGYPPGLDGNALGFIVYDFDASSSGTSHLNLTNLLASGGGEIGGLLSLRGVQDDTDTTAFDAVGDLPEVASRVEAIARDLLTTFNQMYMGDVNGDGVINSSDDENSGTAAINASAVDLDGGTPGTFGMFNFSGATDNGDGLATSADLSAINKASYAAVLNFAISDPRKIALAFDTNTTAGAVAGSPGDARNITGLLAARDATRTFSAGNYSQSTTIDQVYNDLVGDVGNKSATAAKELSIQQDQENQIKELVSSVSGVNLDEEFANLIKFQRAFEGSARLVSVGDQLLQTILQLAG